MTGGIKAVSIIIVTILILGGGGWYFYAQQNGTPNFEFVVVERGDLVQQVSITGRVNPVDMVDLGFSTNGTLETLAVEVGDVVEKDAVLATLDDDEVQADLTQALAALSSARAKLSQFQAQVDKEKATLADLERGTRQEEITLQEVKVANAMIALDLARSDVVSTLEDSYTKADDAVRSKLDVIFSGPRSSSPSVAFTTANAALESSVELKRSSIEGGFVSWRASLDALSVSDNLITASSDAKIILTDVRNLLDDASLLVAGGVPSGTITQTTLDGYESDISTGRSNVNTAFSNVIAKEVALTTAEANLKVEENQLTVLQSGTSVEQIDAQKATVAQAEANFAIQRGAINEAAARVTKARTVVDNTILRASIAGTVTAIVPEVGESITANAKIISIISEGQFEIEADITETDIVLVALDQQAAVTLDAYGDDVVFDVAVAKIDPAEKVIEGIPTYNVTFTFVEPDERVRSGMTANIDVTTAVRNNVIAIPQRAVTRSNGDRAVRVLQGEEFVLVPVKLGIRGSDGRIEILSGISEGDRVITFIEEN